MKDEITITAVPNLNSCAYCGLFHELTRDITLQFCSDKADTPCILKKVFCYLTPFGAL